MIILSNDNKHRVSKGTLSLWKPGFVGCADSLKVHQPPVIPEADIKEVEYIKLKMSK